MLDFILAMFVLPAAIVAAAVILAALTPFREEGGFPQDSEGGGS